MTLSEFFETRYTAAHSLGPTTLAYYRKYLRRFDRWLSRPTTLDDLTDETTSGFFADVPRSRGAISPIWRFAVACGLGPVVQNRQLLKPRQIHRSIEAWSRSEFVAILAAAGVSPGVDRATGVPHAAYWVALVRTVHESKLPYGDLLRLTIAAADKLPLSRLTREAIQETKPETRPTIFGSGCSRSMFRNLRYPDFRRLIDTALNEPSPEAVHSAPTTSFASFLNSFDD